MLAPVRARLAVVLKKSKYKTSKEIYGTYVYGEKAKIKLINQKRERKKNNRRSLFTIKMSTRW